MHNTLVSTSGIYLKKRSTVHCKKKTSLIDSKMPGAVVVDFAVCIRKMLKTTADGILP